MNYTAIIENKLWWLYLFLNFNRIIIILSIKALLNQFNVSKRRKIPKNVVIAGVEVDLLQSREENWTKIEQAVHDSFSSKGLYKSLMKRVAPTRTKDAWGKFVSVIVRIVSFFYGLFFMSTAHRKKPILASVKRKLDEYYFDTRTQIQISQAKLRKQIQKLDVEVADIDNEIYNLEDKQRNADLTEMHQQELEMMHNRFLAEKELRKAKISLLLKCLEQSEKLEKNYRLELSMQESRIKLEKLRMGGDEDLSTAIEADSKIQILKGYALQLESTQEDIIKEEDYQRIIELEREVERIVI